MGYFVNNILDNKNTKYLNKVNEIGVDEQGEENKNIENEGVIHRDTPETETNRNTLKRVIKAFTYDIDDKYGEETTETENECVIQREFTENKTETNQYTLNKVME